MFTAEEFMQAYRESGMDDTLVTPEIKALVKTLTPRLVSERLSLHNALKSAFGVTIAFSIAEEAYLLEIILTMQKLNATRDPFFSKLEEEMKNVPRT